MNWQELSLLIGEDPLWYKNPQKYEPVDQAIQGNEINMPLVQAFATCLIKGKIPLAGWEEGKNDDDRKAVDTVVIHHTDTDSNISLAGLNALGFIRLYAPLFKNGTFDGSVGSGHYNQKGQEIFYGYHHIVRPNGLTERLLKDEYTGFHAGNYGVNCTSVGIAIVDDLTDKWPTSPALTSVANIIRQSYPNATIVGHREVSKIPTECPGNKWDAWKAYLLEVLSL